MLENLKLVPLNINTNFLGSHFKSANFYHSNVSGANFISTQMHDVTFHKATLEGAKMEKGSAADSTNQNPKQTGDAASPFIITRASLSELVETPKLVVTLGAQTPSQVAKVINQYLRRMAKSGNVSGRILIVKESASPSPIQSHDIVRWLNDGGYTTSSIQVKASLVPLESASTTPKECYEIAVGWED